MLPYQLHQKLRAAQAQQQGITSSSSLSVLRGLPFWLWDQQQHREEHIRTNGQCCFNHVVGLPQKDKKEYPLFDYEKLLYDTLLCVDGDFKDRHLWVKKATGLGVTEFMLRLMAWLGTIKQTNHSGSTGNSQMCIMTGPNIDIATKIIKRLKGIFDTKLGLTFNDKETVL
jgi:hypothetical protein